MDDTFKFAEWFRGSAPYIDAHRGRTFVVLVEGEALREDHREPLIQDLALLHTLGVRVVMVFGVRAQAHAALAEAGIDPRRLQGREVLDDDAMTVIEAEANRLRLALEARFSVGLPNSPMHGLEITAVSGNLVMAKPLGVREGVDFSRSGEVRRVRADAIRRLLDQRALVIVPPLGHSSTGEVFDLDAADVARCVAVELRADKLILLGQAHGLSDAQGELKRQLTPQEAEAVSFDRLAQPELARQLDAACAAARQGVARTHLLSWHDRDALLGELFTRDGVGTMITHERYEQLRPARLEDIGGMLELMLPLEEKGVLIPRSRERLEQQIDDYRVIVRDGMVIGCIALHRFDEARMGELACAVVHQDYRGGERGDLLLRAVEEEARRRGYQALFALTTHTSHWFLERGFRLGAPEELPETRRVVYNVARNSKVLIKALD
ncbi:amino-acid N-acetyltransferase [Halotalea alkalilenta]|uniref:amino-acid N-acetyltransferase n=1 Tax=Halotalea alkalilenta TaxID=376489 RepID=UPI00048365D9|nr:amino-acid N-acetyltransferase [Halotalea alkalilenta]